MAKNTINRGTVQAEKPVIITPSQAEIDALRGYTESRWCHPSAPPEGHINYECSLCQYSTLWLEKMTKHVAEGDHPWAFPGGAAPSFTDTPTGEPDY